MEVASFFLYLHVLKFYFIVFRIIIVIFSSKIRVLVLS